MLTPVSSVSCDEKCAGLTHNEDMDIGDSIRKHREAAKVSQSALAQACGVTRSSVSQWESGKTTPSREHIQAAAKFLNVSRADLGDGDEDQERPGGDPNEVRLAEAIAAIMKAAGDNRYSADALARAVSGLYAKAMKEHWEEIGPEQARDALLAAFAEPKSANPY